MISILVSIFLSFLGIVTAAINDPAYYNSLSSFINKEHNFSKGNGTISVEAASLVYNKRSEYDSYFKDFSFYLFDAFDKLVQLHSLLKDAELASATGDRLYLYNYIAFNGQDEQVELSSSSAFKQEVCKFLDINSLNDTSTLSASSGNADLSLFYQQIQIEDCGKSKNIARDSTSCDGSHAPNAGNCQALADDLEYNHGGDVFSDSPRSYCLAGCCVSWSAPISATGDWLSAKAGWCIQQCVNAGLSCEIFGVVYANKTLDFCLSYRADGCT